MSDVRYSRLLFRQACLLLALVALSSRAFLVQYCHHQIPPTSAVTQPFTHSLAGRRQPHLPERNYGRGKDGSVLLRASSEDGGEGFGSSKKRGGKKRGGGGGRGGRGGRRSDESIGQEWGGESRRSAVQPAKAEFSRNIDVTELSRKAKFFNVEATREECALLAERFSVEKIDGLKAEVKVLRSSGRDSRKLKVKGKMVSHVTQICAASLKPFDLPIEKDFDTVIQEVSLDSVDSTLWALEEDSETDDEIMEGDPLDIGEITAQALALSIDPFATHPDHKRGEFDMSKMTDGDFEKTISRAALGPDRFAPRSKEEDVVLDTAAMKAFFEADD